MWSWRHWVIERRDSGYKWPFGTVCRGGRGVDRRLRSKVWLPRRLLTQIQCPVFLLIFWFKTEDENSCLPPFTSPPTRPFVSSLRQVSTTCRYFPYSQVFPPFKGCTPVTYRFPIVSLPPPSSTRPTGTRGTTKVRDLNPNLTCLCSLVLLPRICTSSSWETEIRDKRNLTGTLLVVGSIWLSHPSNQFLDIRTTTTKRSGGIWLFLIKKRRIRRSTSDLSF